MFIIPVTVTAKIAYLYDPLFNRNVTRNSLQYVIIRKRTFFRLCFVKPVVGQVLGVTFRMSNPYMKLILGALNQSRHKRTRSFIYRFYLTSVRACH